VVVLTDAAGLVDLSVDALTSRPIIIIIIIKRKFITRTCSQALSRNRRRGGIGVCVGWEVVYCNGEWEWHFHNDSPIPIV